MDVGERDFALVVSAGSDFTSDLTSPRALDRQILERTGVATDFIFLSVEHSQWQTPLSSKTLIYKCGQRRKQLITLQTALVIRASYFDVKGFLG